ncbi:hypothetical protein OZL92_10175 [Bacillus sonorensis]|uniref:Uncharacterized protein n=1 Tax=Bacillus sonorensis L12 TaxID=1274524 RepID=M5PBK1_9BACI|nr:MULTISPECIES: hypothetical protein [Bacillus]TWK79306.1 hypothetical protein CHCC20335_0083 [Bacillus paralicheniformis]EME73050.1 hypothetical protein BSONL12_14989 [Bacillus sonorensis L12]MBG9914063.1 hypothetical protein [Bacillus sonorensis]MCY8026449.1 hypothetical protein [Bacillus sonorensis]MCY8271366.1 hypothetical protein [Bacillus sonorensis]
MAKSVNWPPLIPPQARNIFSSSHSLYEGRVFPCRITATFNRGRLVYDGSGPLRQNGGKWLKTVEYAKARRTQEPA